MNREILDLRDQLREKKQASDLLYCTLKEAIARGLLPAGTRLREEDLADFFQVSRTPVREAMKKLEMERLVDSSANGGCFVRSLTLDECLDTLEVLEMLRRVSYEHLMGRIPRVLLMILEQNTSKGHTLTDPSERYDNNAEFHDILVRATGNSVLYNLHQQLTFTERIIANTILPVHFVDDYADYHRDLVTAIVNNDQAGVQKEVNHSKERVEDYMRRIVAAAKTQGL